MAFLHIHHQSAIIFFPLLLAKSYFYSTQTRHAGAEWKHLICTGKVVNANFPWVVIKNVLFFSLIVFQKFKSTKSHPQNHAFARITIQLCIIYSCLFNCKNKVCQFIVVLALAWIRILHRCFLKTLLFLWPDSLKRWSTLLLCLLSTIWYELHAREWPYKSQPAEVIIWQIGSGMKPNLAQTGMGKEILVRAFFFFFLTFQYLWITFSFKIS